MWSTRNGRCHRDTIQSPSPLAVPESKVRPIILADLNHCLAVLGKDCRNQVLYGQLGTGRCRRPAIQQTMCCRQRRRRLWRSGLLGLHLKATEEDFRVVGIDRWSRARTFAFEACRTAFAFVPGLGLHPMRLFSFLATLLAHHEVLHHVRVILRHVVVFELSFSLERTRMSTVGALARQVRSIANETGATAFSRCGSSMSKAAITSKGRRGLLGICPRSLSFQGQRFGHLLGFLGLLDLIIVLGLVDLVIHSLVGIVDLRPIP